MAVTRWTLTNSELGSLTLPRNPIEGVIPEREKNFTVETSTSPAGQPLFFMGREKPANFSISGSVKDEDHLDLLTSLFESGVPTTFTDQNGRSHTVFITKFSAKPRNRHNNPWSATYEMSGTYTAL